MWPGDRQFDARLTALPYDAAATGQLSVEPRARAQRVMASFLADPTAPGTGCVAALKPPPFTIAPR